MVLRFCLFFSLSFVDLRNEVSSPTTASGTMSWPFRRRRIRVPLIFWGSSGGFPWLARGSRTCLSSSEFESVPSRGEHAIAARNMEVSTTNVNLGCGTLILDFCWVFVVCQLDGGLIGVWYSFWNDGCVSAEDLSEIGLVLEAQCFA